MRICLVCVLAAVLSVSTGCSAIGSYPHQINTNVELSHANYKVVKSNVEGTSTGFGLIGLWPEGLIPIVPPRYTVAVEDMHAQAFPSGMEGRSVAMVNVVTQESGLNLIVFVFPRLTVRADYIEFNNTP